MKIVTLDFETTGVDVENDRIITCFMRAKDGDKVVFERNWVIDSGVEVPVEAAEVHGMSTEWVRENGRKDVAEAIEEIHRTLTKYAVWYYLVCGYNHAFDLSILKAEVTRHGPEDAWYFPGEAEFLDPAIFSRKFDRFKKGGHQLITVAKRNGIEVEEDRLHTADYDVEVTEKLVKVFLNRSWKELASLRQGLTPDEFITKLQEWQAEWKFEWASGLTDYFAKVGKTENDDGKTPIVVDGKFPF